MSQQLKFQGEEESNLATREPAKPLKDAQMRGALFVYTHLNMANLIPFTKRFESSVNLVNLLESRGLQICDRNKAIQYLDYIGYYRLSALLLLLEKPVVIIQEYKTSKMPFSQQFPLVPQENG